MHIYLVELKSMIFTSFSVYKLTTTDCAMITDFQTDFIRHCEQLKWFLTLSMKISAVQMLSVSAEESWHVITQINT